MVMVRGAKEFLLLPPEEKARLAYEPVPEINRDARDEGGPGALSAGITSNHGLVDAAKPDLARFPAYAQARALRCHVRQGEALLVPAGWHHAVHSPAAGPESGCRNIGVNFWYSAVPRDGEGS